MELDGYNVLEGENIEVYDHMNKHTLCTMVQLNENNAEAGHKIAMQVAAMKPIALDEESVPESVKEEEYKVAVEKTKEEQIEKAVENAVKKAGLNPNHFDSEDTSSLTRARDGSQLRTLLSSARSRLPFLLRRLPTSTRT